MDQKKISQIELEGFSKQTADIIGWFHKNLKSLIAGLVVFIVVFVGFSSYRAYKASRIVDAANSLSDVGSVDDLQMIVTKYADTPSAPVAMLALGNFNFDNAQFAAARAVFQEFTVKYPKHVMKPSAEIAIAYCNESEGQLDSALSQFKAFGQAYPDHYLYAPSVLGIGRCLEQMGKLDEAEQVYKDFIELKSGSQWVAQAETALMYLDTQKRAMGIEVSPAN
ncbi:MAG: tetratricopeptide repeat protein [Spartobacteria bacterium]|nr:tetratricopeptide repeat protein [Spartobacteria bacterium]